MAKKRKNRNKPKPLLALEGIVHLAESFVPPSEESGLLNTVGGDEECQGLILAPNYGYGIPASTLFDKSNDQEQPKEKERSDYKSNEDEKENGEDPQSDKMDTEETGSPVTSEKENSDSNGSEELSVAVLVRHIGGAKKVPIVRSDVVDDRDLPEEPEKDLVPDDPETQNFYESLGIARPNNTAPSTSVPTEEPDDTAGNPNEIGLSGKETAVDSGVSDPSSGDTLKSTTESIADYYKSYTQYYYSYNPDPYGCEPLQFGSSGTTDSLPTCPNTDESIIDMARRAQRARRAFEAKREAAMALLQKDSKDSDTTDTYDPLPMEIVPSDVVEELSITPDTTLTQYWDYIKENPHDFHRWTYLINYVETTLTLADCRKVYSAFLPLYPYCFGYWKRYSQIEKAHNYFQRALTILQRGLEFIPLSADLWLTYINLYSEVHAHNLDFKTRLREQYELAINNVGLEFRSDALWESYIQWELGQNNLKSAFLLYRRLVQIPTRLYNRHWDNFQEMIRDHHPRSFLLYDEYEYYRKKGCKALKFRYKPEPEVEFGEIRKTSKPEDSLMDFVKEIILEKAGDTHKNTELETDKRWEFEDKIKRPYFHIKALDRRQLNNWDEYLNFEIGEGNYDRIVLLFERCVIACANYESMWCKYARYIENYYRTHGSSSARVSTYLQRSKPDVEIVSKKETDEEEQLIDNVSSLINSMLSELEKEDEREDRIVKEVLDSIVFEVDSTTVANVTNDLFFEAGCCNRTVRESSVDDGISQASTPGNLSGHSEPKRTELPPKPGVQNDFQTAHSVGFTSLISIPTFPKASHGWKEAVRDIYKRACMVHCPRKPSIRLQWAAFEEEMGNTTEARELIEHILKWFPTHLEAKLQLLELERRSGNLERVHSLYGEYMNTKSKEECSVLSMKYARFIYKECGKPDQALAILRKAIKKDRPNHLLYSRVIEICYERFPSDRRGAFAALELALQTKDISDEQKLLFCKKKVIYLQEHGDIKSYRCALDQLSELQAIIRKKEAEMQKWRDFEARLEAQKQQDRQLLQPFPVPSWSSASKKPPQNPVPIDFESSDPNRGDSNEITIETDIFDHTVLDPEAPYKHVPPTQELYLDSSYGYGRNHPETRLIERLGHQQYNAIEAQGYSEDLKDTPEALKILRKRKNPLYIVAPRGSINLNHLNSDTDVPGDFKRPRLQAPVLLSDLITPNSAPCINVPDWFVKEGGELCLSETSRGFSIIRYWPHFLSDEGNQKMFKSIRKSVKWHQKQITALNGRQRHVPRLVSWLGPCDYSHTGLTLDKCEDWPAEILDLLHRLIQLTSFEFNSCSLNLYRTGHDSNGWHADIHPGLGCNPPIASVSLGTLRSFEMRRKNPGTNFIRFPLFPGSLLIMEGATQQDWLHSIPKEPTVKAERLNLTFRVMHAVEDPVVSLLEPKGLKLSSIADMNLPNLVDPVKDTAPSPVGKSASVTKDEPKEESQESQTKIKFHEK